MIDIGTMIKQQVEAQGLTTSAVAKMVGYTRTAVYKVYNRSTIDTETLLRFCKALNFNFFGLYASELIGEVS